MKKLKAYFKSWYHSLHCTWRGMKKNTYTITEPWFRIGSYQVWHTIKIACLCGKVFYNIEDL
jgi:hypothetical protein